MKVDNVKSQMRKGMLEYCIMLLLHKEPAYASDIIQKLKSPADCSGRHLVSVADPSENDDLLSYEWVESTQGPPPASTINSLNKEKPFWENWKFPGKNFNDTVKS